MHIFKDIDNNNNNVSKVHCAPFTVEVRNCLLYDVSISGVPLFHMNNNNHTHTDTATMHDNDKMFVL